MSHTYILTLSCPDRPGIVCWTTSEIFRAGGNILEAAQFDDALEGTFFMRVCFSLPSEEEFVPLRDRIAERSVSWDLTWKIRIRHDVRKVVILVSKFDHCLADLIYRQRIGELRMSIAAIISNHPRELIGAGVPDDIPFHHLPVSAENRREQEARVEGLIEHYGAELVVLARYMQILSDDFSRALLGRCINIHHSFLPGFKGAKPYHQAFARGVKMIGATAHYVTPDLDEGPIIVQDVAVVTHADAPEDLIRKGRDIERRVLAQAVRAHLDDRVILHDHKTVVFPD